MTNQADNKFDMCNQSDSESDIDDIQLDSPFPTPDQLKENEWLKNVWEEFNSYEYQDVDLWNTMQYILKMMKKEKMKESKT